MKRSLHVSAPILAAAAIAFTTGCRETEMQRCVNRQNQVVDADLCKANGEQRILGEKPAPASEYRFYYGGSGSMEPGTLAADGSFTPEQGHNYSTSTKRGGFGKSWPAFVIGGMVAAAIIFGVGE